MRRASVAIPSNIAEGYGRKSIKSYTQFYAIAYGSALELETQIILSKDLKLLNSLSASYDNIKLTSNQVRMGKNILQNYNLKKDNKKDLKYFTDILNMSLTQIKGQIKINKKAIKSIRSILRLNNIYYRGTYTNYRINN